MSIVDKLVSEIRALPDVEKLRLMDAVLNDLDKPEPEIDLIWAEEARKRWAAYKAGRMPTVSYEEVMAKQRQREYWFTQCSEPSGGANAVIRGAGGDLGVEESPGK